MTSRVYVTREALEASVCKDSFFDFVKRFWDTIIPETPVWNWHIEYLCGELQRMAERVFLRQPKENDLIINISPGTTKSTLCSVMLPAWCWTRDPTLRLICGSYAFPLSLWLATQTRNVLRSDKYLRLFPKAPLIEEGKGFLVNSKGGQRVATSTGGSITGFHAHIIIIDDPINPKEAVSKAMLKSANEWFDHTLMTRKIDKKVTPTVLIMQRLHQTDPTGHLLERRGTTPLRHICLPAEKTEDVRPRRLRCMYTKGGLFDPVRLSRKVLETTKKELGEYAYAGQFLQRPVPLGGGMFRTGLLQILTSRPKLRRVIRYWDKAGTAGGGAFTVGTLMVEDTDNRYGVLDVCRGQWEAAERERIIRQTAMADGKGVLIGLEQEPGSGGKESAQSTVKNLAGFRVRIDRPVGDKELRADPYAVQVNAGNVWLLRGEWNREYIGELQFFPFGRYKDQVDSSSGAFALLTKMRLKVGGLGK